MEDGFDCHTIEFYYLMKIQEDNVAVCKKQTDVGEELIWIPMEDIKDSDIKPSFIKRYINEIIDSDRIMHIVQSS